MYSLYIDIWSTVSENSHFIIYCPYIHNFISAGESDYLCLLSDKLFGISPAQCYSILHNYVLSLKNPHQHYNKCLKKIKNQIARHLLHIKLNSLSLIHSLSFQQYFGSHLSTRWHDNFFFLPVLSVHSNDFTITRMNMKNDNNKHNAELQRGNYGVIQY